MLKPYKQPLQFLDGILDRVSTVIGAVALSQFPQFFGQYMQRLGGHLDEARRALNEYIEAAAALNLTLEEYIHEHLSSGSEIFRSSGEVIQRLVERVNSLEQAYSALQDSTIYNRWLIFLREVDWSIAAGTWENFTPGVPTTAEGLTYALAGLLIGWGIYTALKKAVYAPIKALGKKVN
ncbi:MAG: DUF2937 family protein [Bacillota bacterium]|nr:DUF2937 family protein [Bacillota bacterium]